jgi:hypothetical protein
MRHLAFCLIAFIAAPAVAQDGPPLDATELKREVGGFQTPGGLEIGFGAEVRTYVDGKLALQTHLTWTDKGAVRTTSNAKGEEISGATGAGINIGGAPGAGLFVPGDNGGTVVLHGLDSDQISGLVFNTADNRDIRQEVNVTLNVPDLSQFQKDVVGQKLDLRLQDTVARALEGAAR